MRTNEELQREVEERRQTEMLISHAKQEWETSFDAVADPMILTDDKDLIVRCNQTVTKQLGMAYQEILGQTLSRMLFGCSESEAG